MSNDVYKAEVKKLRNEVQLLRDELAIMKRKYEDIIYNLDTDNFSSRFVQEQGDMRTAIEVTAEGIKTKVSNEEFESAMSQTAERICGIVSKNIDMDEVVKVTSPNGFKDKSKIYSLDDELYYYNNISQKWSKVKDDESIQSIFEQTTDGFKLTGDVKVDGSCILTDSLTFNSSDKPLEIEYSANGKTDWHSTFNSNSDNFMRIKIGSQWSDAMKVVGTDGYDGNDVDEYTIFNMLTSGGTEQGLFSAFYDGGEKVYINAEMIQTGKLKADYIDTENLSCTRLYAKNNFNGYSARLNGNWGDFGIFNSLASKDALSNDTYCMFGIYNSFPNVNLFVYGNNFMGYDVESNTIWAKGNWNFSVADVKLPDDVIGGGSGASYAVFG